MWPDLAINFIGKEIVFNRRAGYGEYIFSGKANPVQVQQSARLFELFETHTALEYSISNVFRAGFQAKFHRETAGLPEQSRARLVKQVSTKMTMKWKSNFLLIPYAECVKPFSVKIKSIVLKNHYLQRV